MGEMTVRDHLDRLEELAGRHAEQPLTAADRESALEHGRVVLGQAGQYFMRNQALEALGMLAGPTAGGLAVDAKN